MEGDKGLLLLCMCNRICFYPRGKRGELIKKRLTKGTKWDKERKDSRDCSPPGSPAGSPHKVAKVVVEGKELALDETVLSTKVAAMGATCNLVRVLGVKHAAAFGAFIPTIATVAVRA